MFYKKLPQPWNFINKDTLTQVFFCELCEIFKNTFFTEHLPATASFCNSITHSSILKVNFIYLFKTSFIRQIYNFAIFSFCKYILYSILWVYFIDHNINTRNHISVTLSWRRSLLYRNQSIDLQSKLMDWFLHDTDLRHLQM